MHDFGGQAGRPDDNELVTRRRRPQELDTTRAEHVGERVDGLAEQRFQVTAGERPPPQPGDRLLFLRDCPQALLARLALGQRLLRRPPGLPESLDDPSDADRRDQEQHSGNDHVPRVEDVERVARLEEEVLEADPGERRAQKPGPETADVRRGDDSSEVEGTRTRLALKARSEPDSGCDPCRSDGDQQSSPGEAWPPETARVVAIAARPADSSLPRGTDVCRIVHEGEATVEERDLEDPLNDLRTAHENELTTGLAGTRVGGEQEPETARVDEGHVAKIDHDVPWRPLLDALELLFEHGRRREVELALENDDDDTVGGVSHRGAETIHGS